MSALDGARRLQRVAAALRSGEPVATEDAAAIAAGLNRYLDGEDLDVALSVRPDAGDRPREILRLERRDALLAKGAQLMPGDSHSARACELHRRLSSYEGGRWRARDRIAARNPYAPGTAEGLYWNILTLHPKVLSEERLRRIVAEAGREIRLFVTRDASDGEGV